MGLLKAIDLWQWVAIAAVAGAIFLAGYAKGIEHEADKHLERVVEEANKAQKVIVKQGEVTTRTVVKWKTRVVVQEKIVEKQHEQNKTLVTDADDARCRINNGFVLGWNADNQGASVPETPEGTLRADSVVGLSDVKEQHTREAGICRQTRDALEFCRNWIREQYEATNGLTLEY